MSNAKVRTNGRHVAAAGLMLLTCGSSGCANLGEGSDPFKHPEHGYSIAYPQQVARSQNSVWRRVRVSDSDLAFRGPDDAYIAISSHCDESEAAADPAVLARQLLVGLRDRKRIASETFEFAGGHAFAQTLESPLDDITIRTKTVTWVRGTCVVDWVLAAKGTSPEAEETFDLWWRAFDPGSMSGASHGLAETGP